jgi:hypothetical protein
MKLLEIMNWKITYKSDKKEYAHLFKKRSLKVIIKNEKQME